MTTNMLVDTSRALSHVVAETSASGALTALYVRSGDELLEVLRPGAGATWTNGFIHDDALGSIRMITDGSGAVTDSRAYAAFGACKIAEVGSDPLPYGFAGEPFEGTSSLAYHRARWMDARIGRFAGMDPKDGHQDLPLSLHRYIYGRDNPLSLIDPLGADPDIGSVAAAAPIAGVLATTEGESFVHEAEIVKEAVVVEGEAAFGAASSLVQSWTSGVSIWQFNPFVRGNIIEQALGRTIGMPLNYPVIDRFESGVATSIKSIDLTAASYQNVRQPAQCWVELHLISSPSSMGASEFGDLDTTGGQITSRVLELAVSPLENGLQAQALNALIQYGQRVGVTVQIIVFQ